MEPTEYGNRVNAALRLERPWNRLLLPKSLVRRRFVRTGLALLRPLEAAAVGQQPWTGAQELQEGAQLAARGRRCERCRAGGAEEPSHEGFRQHHLKGRARLGDHVRLVLAAFVGTRKALRRHASCFSLS